MQKVIAFCHEEDIGMLKLSCLHKYTDTNFYTFTEADIEILENLEMMLLVVFLSFSRANQLLMKLFFQKSTNLRKSIASSDASQSYPYPMYQPMPTGPSTRLDLDPVLSRFTLRQNKTCRFEKMVMSFFKRALPERKIESFYTSRREKIDCFSVDEFCSHWNTLFEAMLCF